MGWQGGYVADVPYTSGVYPELGAAHLHTCALLGGVAAPDPAAPYRYLELGCGTGVGLAAFAAANTHARFVGMDFNPAHVAAASELVEAAGLDNLEVREASFADFAPAPLAPDERFQFVVVRGVWTWVGRQAQLDLMRLLEHVTAPGGLVYVGYNDMAAWAPALPLQRLLVTHAARTPGDSLTRVREAVAFALKVDAALPGSFDLRMIRRALDPCGGDPQQLPVPVLSYLAHEYLNEHWRPVFPEELERDLADAKLTLVASADPVANAPELALSQAAAEAVSLYDEADAQRRLAGLVAPQGFRGDIFARGARPLPPDLRAERLGELTLMLVRPREAAPAQIDTGSTRLSLDPAVWGGVYDRLAEGPTRLRELVETAKAGGHAVSLLEAALILLGGGAAAAVARPGHTASAEEEARARRFNVAMMETLRGLSGLRLGLAAARLGGAASASLEECLAYLTLAAPGLLPASLPDARLHAVARTCEPVWRTVGAL